MELIINVDARPMRITGNDIEEITETWEFCRNRGADLGCEVTAKSLNMTDDEQDDLSLVDNVTPAMRHLLDLGGWVEVNDPHSDSHAGEPLSMPSTFDDAPVANYQGAAGYSPNSLNHLPVGPALPLPKLF